MTAWKRLAPWLAGLFILVATTGCAGVNATGSVSPASFFLPGILKLDPPRQAPATTDRSEKKLAQL